MNEKEQKAYNEALRRIEACGRLRRTGLDLSGLGLHIVPRELWKLQDLKFLQLQGNQITILPPELEKLDRLQTLYLHGNLLSTLPSEVGKLRELTKLYLARNHLATLPPELGKLENLKGLYLAFNELTTLPPEIKDLHMLEELDIDRNRFACFPSGLEKLEYLKKLDLRNNDLTALPPEIEKLKRLTIFYLDGNRLTTLPSEIVKLKSLRALTVDGNPMQDPPPSVCALGIQSIRRYFADKQKFGKEILWRSKLMLVGQGRVGKTELRHRLMSRKFGEAKSTEVMEIETVPLKHPGKPGVTMELRCWDFGGQDIYHATHQFFLTGRSLFVFCFEAGKDWDAGKPYYWLDKIAAVAPEAPVVIVATKCDERAVPALPWAELKQRYPQIVGDGCFTIALKEPKRKDQDGDGMPELLACLQNVAADRSKLPLMGEELPVSWVKGMKAVTEHPRDHHLTREDFFALLKDVPKESHHAVALLLRDLGEILYYFEPTDGDLRDWVIIKPAWVTSAAARILDNADVKSRNGILTQDEMAHAWRDYPQEMRPVLLDLLEKYDLTYKIPEDRAERSVIVEQLPKSEEPPPPVWEALKPAPGGCNHEMEMTFKLRSMQAGIPTWFIARKHHYTLRKHWLYGVYFGDNRNDPRHVAQVRASTDPKTPEVRLVVRGPFPQTFFAVMRESLESSITERYPKLIEELTIPCCCQDKLPDAEACTHAFKYEMLLKYLTRNIGAARCDVSLEEVTVAELLFGYDNPVNAQLQEMEARLKDEIHAVGIKVGELATMVRLSFQYLYNDLQAREETHCPNLFVIWKEEKGKAFHVPMRLALVCQHPGCEHIACKAGEAYPINALKEPLRNAAPLLKNVATVLKYAKLAGLPYLKEWDKHIGDWVGDFQEALNEMLKDFDSAAEKGGAPRLLAHDIDGGSGKLQEKQVAGAALREFRAVLDKVDPTQHWHGLEKKKSNQTGDFLWVCAEHAKHGDYGR